MLFQENLMKIVDAIQEHTSNFRPNIGIILGSGLGDLADLVSNANKIRYADIPGFPRSSVSGHKGQMVLGELGKMPVICMQGRIHSYEGAEADTFKIFIRTLKALGCDTLFITNAAGSLCKDVQPGQLMLIHDHINLQRSNPLIGMNDDAFGPRFFAMTDAYDPALRKRFQTVAKTLGVPLPEGVYLAVNGPNFETPAEIRAFRAMGADLVGMSTVPEVLVARHCGLRVAAISSVTNLAAGMSDETLSHEGTLHFAHIAANNLANLIIYVLESLSHEPC